MSLCNNCGQSVKPGVKFCGSCGTKKESTDKILEEERKKAEAKLELGIKDSKRTKMRWGVAIGGAILLAIGLVMVTSGAATGFAGMCWGIKLSGVRSVSYTHLTLPTILLV